MMEQELQLSAPITLLAEQLEMVDGHLWLNPDTVAGFIDDHRTEPDTIRAELVFGLVTLALRIVRTAPQGTADQVAKQIADLSVALSPRVS